jgi:hypothetical protein
MFWEQLTLPMIREEDWVMSCWNIYGDVDTHVHELEFVTYDNVQTTFIRKKKHSPSLKPTTTSFT